MKKIIITILTLSMITALTACGGTESSSQNSSQNSYETAGNSEEISDNVSDNSSSSLPDVTDTDELKAKRTALFGDDPFESVIVDITPETSWVIDDFALDSLPMPDGSANDLSDASFATGDSDKTYALGFDFAYLRYAAPILHTTIDDPDLYNWETEKLSENHSAELDRSDFFKVKAGDVLENGLTVKSAEYWRNKDELWVTTVELDGELTLSGILVRNDETQPYFGEGIYFIADPAEGLVPEIKEDGKCGASLLTIPNEKFAAAFDGSAFYILDENGGLTEDIFGESSCVKATVTLKNIYLGYHLGANYGHSAELVSVEKPVK